jgi:hypothetical protein
MKSSILSGFKRLTSTNRDIEISSPQPQSPSQAKTPESKGMQQPRFTPNPHGVQHGASVPKSSSSLSTTASSSTSSTASSGASYPLQDLAKAEDFLAKLTKARKTCAPSHQAKLESAITDTYLIAAANKGLTDFRKSQSNRNWAKMDFLSPTAAHDLLEKIAIAHYDLSARHGVDLSSFSAIPAQAGSAVQRNIAELALSIAHGRGASISPTLLKDGMQASFSKEGADATLREMFASGSIASGKANWAMIVDMVRNIEQFSTTSPSSAPSTSSTTTGAWQRSERTSPSASQTGNTVGAQASTVAQHTDMTHAFANVSISNLTRTDVTNAPSGHSYQLNDLAKAESHLAALTEMLKTSASAQRPQLKGAILGSLAVASAHQGLAAFRERLGNPDWSELNFGTEQTGQVLLDGVSESHNRLEKTYNVDLSDVSRKQNVAASSESIRHAVHLALSIAHDQGAQVSTTILRQELQGHWSEQSGATALNTLFGPQQHSTHYFNWGAIQDIVQNRTAHATPDRTGSSVTASQTPPSAASTKSAARGAMSTQNTVAQHTKLPQASAAYQMGENKAMAIASRIIGKPAPNFNGTKTEGSRTGQGNPGDFTAYFSIGKSDDSPNALQRLKYEHTSIQHALNPDFHPDLHADEKRAFENVAKAYATAFTQARLWFTGEPSANLDNRRL